MAGFLCVPRDDFSPDDELWAEERRFSRFEAWLDLRQMAAYKARTLHYRGQAIEVPVGGLVASVRTLCARWKWTDKTVMGFLAKLAASGRISSPSPTPAGSLIIVQHNHLRELTDEGAPTAIPTPTPTPTPTAIPTRMEKEEKEEKEEKRDPSSLRSEGGEPEAAPKPKRARKAAATEKPAPDPRTGKLVAGMIDLWVARTDGVAPRGEIIGAVKQLVRAHPHEEIEDRFETFMRSPDYRFGVAFFAKHYGSYADAGTWASEQARGAAVRQVATSAGKAAVQQQQTLSLAERLRGMEAAVAAHRNGTSGTNGNGSHP